MKPAPPVTKKRIGASSWSGSWSLEAPARKLLQQCGRRSPPPTGPTVQHAVVAFVREPLEGKRSPDGEDQPVGGVAAVQLDAVAEQGAEQHGLLLEGRRVGKGRRRPRRLGRVAGGGHLDPQALEAGRRPRRGALHTAAVQHRHPHAGERHPSPPARPTASPVFRVSSVLTWAETMSAIRSSLGRLTRLPLLATLSMTALRNSCWRPMRPKSESMCLARTNASAWMPFICWQPGGMWRLANRSSRVRLVRLHSVTPPTASTTLRKPAKSISA